MLQDTGVGCRPRWKPSGHHLWKGWKVRVNISHQLPIIIIHSCNQYQGAIKYFNEVYQIQKNNVDTCGETNRCCPNINRLTGNIAEIAQATIPYYEIEIYTSKSLPHLRDQIDD